MLEKFSQITKLVSFKEVRNALLGFSFVFCGLGFALFTYYAHSVGSFRIASIAAIASLFFVLLIIIFVVPPLVRSASVEASQLNLPFEFTTGGAIVMGFLVIVAFAAWNTGNNLLFLVLAFMTSALIFSFITGSLCLRRLDVKMWFPEMIFASEPVSIVVILHNRKQIFPTFSVKIEVRGKEREFSKLIDEFRKFLPEKWAQRISQPPIIKHVLDHFVFVPRKDSIKKRVKYVFENRGRFIIHDFELSTRFPFGFFKHRRRLSAQKSQIFIFPKLEQVEERIADMSFEMGNLVSTKKGGGQDLFALRDYHPIDSLRHIDWKATARLGKLIVREFTEEDDKMLTIVFDTQIERTTEEKSETLRQKISKERGDKMSLSASAVRFESGISKAAFLLSSFEKEKAEIRLVIDKEDGDFGTGKRQLSRCLRRLALVEPLYVDTVSKRQFDDFYDKIFEENTNSHVYLFTSVNKKDLPQSILQKALILQY